MSARKNSKQNLLNRLRKERGYLPPEWAFLAEKDPGFMEAYNEFYERVMTDGKALPAKTKELITIGLLAYVGLEQGVCNHAKRALRLGATKEELLEAVETLIIAGGSPTLRTGLAGLIMMEEEEKKGQ
jgi:alkylhydroperoxidase/carboxymuconolactone decarboxylase family protein YurZ